MYVMGLSFLAIRSSEGAGRCNFAAEKIRSGAIQGKLYAYPRQKSIEHFKDEIRQRTVKTSSRYNQGAHRADQPGHSRMGALLLQGPRPQALQPSRCVGSCAGSGRTGISVGDARVGKPCQPQSYMARWDL